MYIYIYIYIYVYITGIKNYFVFLIDAVIAKRDMCYKNSFEKKRNKHACILFSRFMAENYTVKLARKRLTC